MTTPRATVPHYLFAVGTTIRLVTVTLPFLPRGNTTEFFLEFLDFIHELGIVLSRLLPFLVGVSFLVGQSFRAAAFPILMAIRHIVRKVRAPMGLAMLTEFLASGFLQNTAWRLHGSVPLLTFLAFC